MTAEIMTSRDVMYIDTYTHPHELQITRKRKARNVSLYRQGKLAAHRTRGGRGVVGALMVSK